MEASNIQESTDINKEIEDWIVRRPLTSVKETLGSGVMFDCSFLLNKEDPFLYVIWQVGNYVVHRTNSKFCVLNKGEDFFLYIKSLEEDMAGQVDCELRRVLPTEPRKTQFVALTHCYLDIAASNDVEQDGNAKLLKSQRIFQSIPGGSSISKTDPAGCGNDWIKSVQTISKNGTDFIEVKLTYCRLDDDGTFYYYASLPETEVKTTIESKDGNIYFTVDKSYLLPNYWYAIDVCESDGSYLEVGVSSEPCVGMEQPPLLNVVKIRMRPVTPDDETAESTVFIRIAPEKEDVVLLKSSQLRSEEEFQAEYKIIGDRIGFGAFANVYLVQDAKGAHYAAKKVRTKNKSDRAKVTSEYEIMRRLQHPKSIHLVEGFHDRRHFIIVMEHLWGGELFERIANEDFTEDDIVNYVKQICEALVYIHHMNIVHLDIKPENIVCRSPTSSQIKIVDFGLAVVLEGNRSRAALKGTPDYVSPELLNFDPVTTASDMWSVGVVTYLMISGVTPFECEPWSEMALKISRAEYGYDDEAFDHVSLLSRNFVDRLLLLNPTDRLTAEQALEHSWLKHGPPKEDSARISMHRTRENLKVYLATYRNKWHRARNVISAARRLLASRHASATHRSPSESSSTSSTAMFIP